jgi:methionyl-tRNA synthetase
LDDGVPGWRERPPSHANGEQHIGHVAKAYVPPDVFARFHRILGSDVVIRAVRSAEP